MAAAEPPKNVVFTYFDAAGRGEPVRNALRLAKISFEDKRISYDEFAKLKPSLPFGSVPVLEVEGKVLSQTTAQLLYIGQWGNLLPECSFGRAQVAEILGACEDGINFCVPAFLEKDADKKKAMIDELLGDTGKATLWMNNVKRYLAKNQSGFIVGDRISVADLKLESNLDFLVGVCGEDVFKSHAELSAYQTKIKALLPSPILPSA